MNGQLSVALCTCPYSVVLCWLECLYIFYVCAYVCVYVFLDVSLSVCV